MPTQQEDFTKVAKLPEVPEGKPKAVRVKGHSIALFNIGGRIYATDNQCPHMGYPLTRGAIRHGVLTCDWHGWSFDLEGGGCFVGGCDDLATFPVEFAAMKSGGPNKASRAGGKTICGCCRKGC